MKVQFALVGHVERRGFTVEMDVVPREGEIVCLPGISQADTVVRTVVYYVTHDDEENPIDEPFAYVVIGKPRP